MEINEMLKGLERDLDKQLKMIQQHIKNMTKQIDDIEKILERTDSEDA